MSQTNKLLRILFLNTKSFLLNWKAAFQNFIFVVFCSLILILMVPMETGFGLMLSILIIYTSSSTFLRTYIKFKTTTIKNNLKIIGTKESIITISSLISTIIESLLVSFLFYLILFISSKLGILTTQLIDIGKPDPNDIYLLDFKNSFYFIYQIILITLITFSIYFMINRFNISEKLFMVIVVILFVFTFVSAGLLNNFFYISTVYLLPKFDTPTNHGLFIPSLFSPYFSVSQQLSSFMRIKTLDVRNPDLVTPWIWLTKEKLSSAGNSWMDQVPWRWNILFFVPYMHISFYFGLSFLINKINPGKTL